MMPFAISLGANLEDRSAALQGAVDALAATDGVRVRDVSPVFETAPVGGPEQPDYLNAVVIGDTDLSPHALLAVAQSIEQEWHRTREVRWGPRTLDIDIITMGSTALDSADLTIPHPRAHERAFVCVPLLAVDPSACIGATPVAELVATLDSRGVAPADNVTLHIGEDS